MLLFDESFQAALEVPVWLLRLCPLGVFAKRGFVHGARPWVSDEELAYFTD